MTATLGPRNHQVPTHQKKTYVDVDIASETCLLLNDDDIDEVKDVTFVACKT